MGSRCPLGAPCSSPVRLSREDARTRFSWRGPGPPTLPRRLRQENAISSPRWWLFAIKRIFSVALQISICVFPGSFPCIHLCGVLILVFAGVFSCPVCFAVVFVSQRCRSVCLSWQAFVCKNTAPGQLGPGSLWLSCSFLRLSSLLFISRHCSRNRCLGRRCCSPLAHAVKESSWPVHTSVTCYNSAQHYSLSSIQSAPAAAAVPVWGSALGSPVLSSGVVAPVLVWAWSALSVFDGGHAAQNVTSLVSAVARRLRRSILSPDRGCRKAAAVWAGIPSCSLSFVLLMTVDAVEWTASPSGGELVVEDVTVMGVVSAVARRLQLAILSPGRGCRKAAAAPACIPLFPPAWLLNYRSWLGGGMHLRIPMSPSLRCGGLMSPRGLATLAASRDVCSQRPGVKSWLRRNESVPRVLEGPSRDRDMLVEHVFELVCGRCVVLCALLFFFLTQPCHVNFVDRLLLTDLPFSSFLKPLSGMSVQVSLFNFW